MDDIRPSTKNGPQDTDRPSNTPEPESDKGVKTTVPIQGVHAVRRDEYPTGARLILIIISLCLAIFLTSLDMVCIIMDLSPRKITSLLIDLDFLIYYE